jgi:hypothetical protein
VIDGEFESDFRLFGIERDPALEVLIVFRVAAFFRRLFRPRRDAFLAAMRFRMSPFPFRVAPVVALTFSRSHSAFRDLDGCSKKNQTRRRSEARGTCDHDRIRVRDSLGFHRGGIRRV